MLVRSIAFSFVITAVIGAILFGAAGTLHWFGAELFLATILGCGFVMQSWLALHDPELFRERASLAREKNPRERTILMLVNLYYAVWLGLMGLDARWHGTTQLPPWANIAGALAIMAGFLGTMRVFAANSFASGLVRVQRDRGQRVVDTGPYAIVRHPMYAVVIFTYLAIPFTLGCAAGLWGVPPLVLLLAMRTLAEENLLQRELPGYGAYMTKVRYRFVPFFW